MGQTWIGKDLYKSQHPNHWKKIFCPILFWKLTDRSRCLLCGEVRKFRICSKTVPLPSLSKMLYLKWMPLMPAQCILIDTLLLFLILAVLLWFTIHFNLAESVLVTFVPFTSLKCIDAYVLSSYHSLHYTVKMAGVGVGSVIPTSLLEDTAKIVSIGNHFGKEHLDNPMHTSGYIIII